MVPNIYIYIYCRLTDALALSMRTGKVSARSHLDNNDKKQRSFLNLSTNKTISYPILIRHTFSPMNKIKISSTIIKQEKDSDNSNSEQTEPVVLSL
jgi:hypothetical protein